MYTLEKILAQWKHGRGWQDFIKWVGYGDEPLFTEFDKNGNVVSQFQLSPPGDVEAYRTFKLNYTTNPTTTAMDRVNVMVTDMRLCAFSY